VVERLIEKGADFNAKANVTCSRPCCINHLQPQPSQRRAANAACTLNAPSFTACALSTDTPSTASQSARPTYAATASPLAIINQRANEVD
jgi:hypothetical protein